MSNCMTIKGGDRIRLTRLDGCGRPVYGECNAVVTQGVVEVKMSPEVDDKDPKEQKNFAGNYCYSEATCAVIKYWNIEITWCEINFAAFQMINPTYDLIYDDDGQVLGYYTSTDVDCSRGYAMEMWLQLAGDSDVCTGEDSEGVWGYVVIPWVTGGVPDDITISDSDAITFVTKSTTKNGGRWGTGPYQVLLDSKGNPVGLPKPLGGKQPWGVLTTSMPPPEADCDCVEVERPVPPEADVSIEGLPGEEPRTTVILRPDNHGFGTVTVDWGDGSEPEETNDLSKISHKYLKDGEYPVKVCDKQDPDVCTTKTITVPLPDDNPSLKLDCTTDKPLTAVATVKLPKQAGGQVWITWGDNTPDQLAEVGEDGTVKLTHLYKRPGRYTVTARRGEKKTFRDRRTITLPCKEVTEKPDAPKA